MSARSLTLTALAGLPLVEPGDDLAALLAAALRRTEIVPEDGDILVVAQKVVSKAEGRIVDLADVIPSARAVALAQEVGKDARLVEIILSESSEVVRHRKDVLIVAHRLGFVMANAGVDQSNVAGGGERVLLLPRDPDASAAALKTKLDSGVRRQTRRSSSTTVLDALGATAWSASRSAPPACRRCATWSARPICSAARCG